MTMPKSAVNDLSCSVRTCFACNRRRYPPAFVAWNHDTNAVYTLCTGCLDRSDRDDWAKRFLRTSGAKASHSFYYIAGEGTWAAEVFAPLLREAFAQGKVIVRDLHGLSGSTKDFWQRVRSGPAPRGWIEMGTDGRVMWSETVWESQPGE